MRNQSKRKAKREHRESTLPPGHANRILDRLLLLEKVIPPGEVRVLLHRARLHLREHFSPTLTEKSEES